MRTRSLLLAILIACNPALSSGPCPACAPGHDSLASLVSSQPGGTSTDAPVGPLRKAVLGDENDREEDTGRPDYACGDALVAAGSPQWVGPSGSWPGFHAGRGLHSAPLYISLRTLLI